MSHIRNEGERLIEAVDEAFAIGARGRRCRVQISHHKAAAPQRWGKTNESIALIEKARAAGVDVTFDAYPYTAGSTILAVMAARPRGRARRRHRRHRPQQATSTRARRSPRSREMLDIPTAPRSPQRVLADEPSAVAVFFMMDEADVRRVLAHPLCMIGSDGIPSPTGKPHPRLYGTFPRVLGMYVARRAPLPARRGRPQDDVATRPTHRTSPNAANCAKGGSRTSSSSIRRRSTTSPPTRTRASTRPASST